MSSARKLLFDDLTLKIFETTPEAGETESAEFTADWFGQRSTPTTDGTSQAEVGMWQFQIWAEDDWETSQTFMLKAVALTIGERRWKIKKIEQPIGHSTVWKIKAQLQ
jgi:hypothetical protein